jgi:phosphinothricin acetyltransferase
MNVGIRPAHTNDLARINEIYNGYIVDSPISFDLEPWDLGRRAEWWEHYAETGPYRVLVAEVAARVVGAAYSTRYREKAAYRSSVETTVVLDPDYVRVGIGRRLLSALLDVVRSERVHRAYAIITVPNEASVGLHEALGYRHVGTLNDVGFKLGRYWSIVILERRLED